MKSMETYIRVPYNEVIVIFSEDKGFISCISLVP